MVEEISDTIKEKIKEITDNPNEQKILVELLQKTANYDKQTKPLMIKKEFTQLLDEHFPLKQTDSDE
tara:strand:- start:242 stop:442 length:201 start_codon:yes stop_codon:yes gene_type:complete